MELKATDYESLRELSNSHGWKLVCDYIDEKIKPIEKLLLDPYLDEIVWLEDEKKQENLTKYKKMERIHLLNMKNIPETLLSTKINIDKKTE